MLILNEKIRRRFPKFPLWWAIKDQVERVYWGGHPLVRRGVKAETGWRRLCESGNFQKPGRLEDGVCGGAQRVAGYMQILQGPGLHLVGNGE